MSKKIILDDVTISKAIIEEYNKKLVNALNTDVSIVGGGPAGMMAAYLLAKKGYKVNLFERKLSLGGGMWGGGIMFNKIVVQEEAKKLLEKIGVGLKRYKKGYYTACSIETVGALCYNAAKAGANIFNLFSVEDLKVNANNDVNGVVVNWSSVQLANLHVDPITFGSKYIVEATGHACEVANIILKRLGSVLYTSSKKILGEGSMNADCAETVILDNTREIYKNVFACGMSANAIFGTNRMGPIFGGMILSGEKVANVISKRLKKAK